MIEILERTPVRAQNIITSTQVGYDRLAQKTSDSSICDGWTQSYCASQSLLAELYAGCPEASRMKMAAKNAVWWPGIDSDLEFHSRQ